ncbi:MAG: prolyl oligopeptidase family serine peptidase [Hyphomicrobiaceae bacterium]|jgi:polyhydroxybutyrate depolymerase
MPRRLHTRLLALVVFVSLAMAASARAGELGIHTRDGVRTAIVLPASQAPAPTAIVLHGAINSPAWTARISGFTEAAQSGGFTAVFPKGAGLTWSDGRQWEKVDDVGFLRGLVAELIRRGIADPDRIYIAGISNGGMMALRMLCEASELFAGVGTVIASMPAAIGRNCHPGRAVSIVMVNGTADALIPYDGGWVGPLGVGGVVWGAEQTAAYLARLNGCGRAIRKHVSNETVLDLASVTRIAWASCAPGAGVTLYRVNGGGHQIFGRRSYFSALFGNGHPKISAAEVIMAKFAEDAQRQGTRADVRGKPRGL